MPTVVLSLLCYSIVVFIVFWMNQDVRLNDPSCPALCRSFLNPVIASPQQQPSAFRASLLTARAPSVRLRLRVRTNMYWRGDSPNNIWRLEFDICPYCYCPYLSSSEKSTVLYKVINNNKRCFVYFFIHFFVFWQPNKSNKILLWSKKCHIWYFATLFRVFWLKLVLAYLKRITIQRPI